MLLNPRQAGQKIKVSTAIVHRAVEAGIIPATYTPQGPMIESADVDFELDTRTLLEMIREKRALMGVFARE